MADDKFDFKEENFAKLKQNFPEDLQEAEKDEMNGKNKEITAKIKGTKSQVPSTESELRRLVNVLKSRELFPFIVFSFSRRECEAYAQYISSSKKKKGPKPQAAGDALDLNNEEEKEAVQSIFDAALQCLDEKDRELPCIQSMLPMLLRGVGVHHSGLLPILKEIVELLFQENLVKCLFSTETFAMGLNMPAKTVVFTSLTKWDGQVSRPLSSGEYIQMSGRAGRRGKDDRGFAMMLVDPKLSKEECKAMLKGEASALHSSFRLSYYTLLNLIRSRSLGRKDDMEYVISKSFQQFQHEQQTPLIAQEAKELRDQADKMISSEVNMTKYMEQTKKYEESRAQIRKAMLQPIVCLNVLRPGRIVRVNSEDIDWGYGVILCVQRLTDSPPSDPKSYIADVMLCCKNEGKEAAPCDLNSKEGAMLVIPVALPFISEINTLRVALPSSLKVEKNKESVRSTLKALLQRYPDGHLPELHPIDDLGIAGEEAENIQKYLKDQNEAKKAIKEFEVSEMLKHCV